MMTVKLNVDRAPITGEPTTPAMAASIIPMIHAHRDVRRSSTPRDEARSGRSTTARMRRPSVVLRSSTHSAIEQIAAAISTVSWFESNGTSPGSVQSFFGTGPTPAGNTT